jgi:hypothetical protein
MRKESNRVSAVMANKLGVTVIVAESGQERGPHVSYVLDRTLKVIDVYPSNDFRAEHDSLEASGKVHHSFQVEMRRLEKVLFK